MKKLIVSILLFSFALLAGAQQYEYKINARTGKPDMVLKASNLLQFDQLQGVQFYITGEQRLCAIDQADNSLFMYKDHRLTVQGNNRTFRVGNSDFNDLVYLSKLSTNTDYFIRCSLVNLGTTCFSVNYNGVVNSSSYSVNGTSGLTGTRTFNEQSANNLQYRVNTVTITGGIITAWTQGTWTNH